MGLPVIEAIAGDPGGGAGTCQSEAVSFLGLLEITAQYRGGWLGWGRVVQRCLVGFVKATEAMAWDLIGRKYIHCALCSIEKKLSA